MEEWRPARGWPYEASSLGRIRRVPAAGARAVYRAVLKPVAVGKYLAVTLSKDGLQRRFYVGPLICEAFHGPRPSPQHQADHDDEDTLNNEASNLKWLTQAENLARRKHRYGEENPAHTLTDEQVRAIVAVRYRRGLYSAQAVEFSVTPSHIRALHLGTKRARSTTERHP